MGQKDQTSSVHISYDVEGNWPCSVIGWRLSQGLHEQMVVLGSEAFFLREVQNVMPLLLAAWKKVNVSHVRCRPERGTQSA